ncbi:major facilitator superfamily domain-containing protein [Amylostereum chailletii]|nr:major facilitator superfamily domain-containing protein [Amylostereum chailletii]
MDEKNPVREESSTGSSTGSGDTVRDESLTPAPAHRMDGGLQAWASVAGGWLIMFAVFGYANAFGVFQDLYTRAGTASPSAVSWIGSVQVFLMVGMALPAGRLVDAGYFRPLLCGGSALFAFFVFMLSLAHTDKYYQLFLAQGLGVGFSGGLLYLPAVAIQARHWKARRALAMGIVFSGSAIGGVLFPIMLNRLFHHSALSFGWSVRASAFLITALLALANVLMTPGPAPPAPPAGIKTLGGALGGMLRDAPYVAVTLGAFLVNCGFYFPYFYIQLFAVLHGVEANLAFYTLSIMNAASIFGRLLPSVLADAIGPFNTYLPACAATGALLLALLGIASPAAVVVFGILYGFCSGAVIALIAPLIATLTANPAEIGTRMGATFFVMSFGSLLGTPISGALLGASDRATWWRPIVFSAVLVLVGSAVVGGARDAVARRKGTRKV